jgi:hypothetical protein
MIWVDNAMLDALLKTNGLWVLTETKGGEKS